MFTSSLKQLEQFYSLMLLKKMLYNASLQECSVGKIFLDKKVWPITVHGEENSLTPRCPNFQLFKFKGQYSMSICKFTLNSVLDIHFRRSKAKN